MMPIIHAVARAPLALSRPFFCAPIDNILTNLVHLFKHFDIRSQDLMQRYLYGYFREVVEGCNCNGLRVVDGRWRFGIVNNKGTCILDT